jgi:hypothetical protein
MIRVKLQTLIPHNQILTRKFQALNKLGSYYTFVYIRWNVSDSEIFNLQMCAL